MGKGNKRAKTKSKANNPLQGFKFYDKELEGAEIGKQRIKLYFKKNGLLGINVIQDYLINLCSKKTGTYLTYRITIGSKSKKKDKNGQLFFSASKSKLIYDTKRNCLISYETNTWPVSGQFGAGGGIGLEDDWVDSSENGRAEVGYPTPTGVFGEPKSGAVGEQSGPTGMMGEPKSGAVGEQSGPTGVSGSPKAPGERNEGETGPPKGYATQEDALNSMGGAPKAPENAGRPIYPGMEDDFPSNGVGLPDGFSDFLQGDSKGLGAFILNELMGGSSVWMDELYSDPAGSYDPNPDGIGDSDVGGISEADLLTNTLGPLIRPTNPSWGDGIDGGDPLDVDFIPMPGNPAPIDPDPDGISEPMGLPDDIDLDTLVGQDRKKSLQPRTQQHKASLGTRSPFASRHSAKTQSKQYRRIDSLLPDE